MDAGQLKSHIESVAAKDKLVAQAVRDIGHPAPRRRPPGFESAARILVAQQLSVKAAASIFAKVEQLLCEVSPQAVLAAETDNLRAAGLSRPKIKYIKALAEHVVDGQLVFENLPHMPDEEAMAAITAVKGFGPWSAQIYLLFCEGRADVWPAGDLALQEALRRLKGLKERPSAPQTVDLVEPWQPVRGAMAIFLWHYYAQSAAPV